MRSVHFSTKPSCSGLSGSHSIPCHFYNSIRIYSVEAIRIRFPNWISFSSVPSFPHRTRGRFLDGGNSERSLRNLSRFFILRSERDVLGFYWASLRRRISRSCSWSIATRFFVPPLRTQQPLFGSLSTRMRLSCIWIFPDTSIWAAGQRNYSGIGFLETSVFRSLLDRSGKFSSPGIEPLPFSFEEVSIQDYRKRSYRFGFPFGPFAFCIPFGIVFLGRCSPFRWSCASFYGWKRGFRFAKFGSHSGFHYESFFPSI